MKIWGLGWQNCLGSFQGLAWPQPATKKSSHRKRECFHYLGLQAEEL